MKCEHVQLHFRKVCIEKSYIENACYQMSKLRVARLRPPSIYSIQTENKAKQATSKKIEKGKCN